MTRILMSAGGTGGGVYPALAVARALHETAPQTTLEFVGSARGIEHELIEKSGFQFARRFRVQGGPVHGMSILGKLLSAFRLALGLLQSLLLLARRRPQVIFLTGGWVSLPVALAGWLYRIPIVIFVPDIEPGRTLKLLGQFARVITATVQDTEKYYAPDAEVIATGYPLRPRLLEATRQTGIEAYGLDADKRTLLVFGGSRGSRAINTAILQNIEALLATPNLQILHVSGKLDAEEVRQDYEKLPDDIQSRYHLYDYLHDIGLAFASADLVISRAGAATLAEFPLFGLPAILIPLAYSWRYQEVNADWLARHGAAIRLDETRITEELVPLIQDLFTHTERLQAMRAAAQALAKTDGAANIARIVINLSRA